MPLILKCDRCRDQIYKPGGLLFSIPIVKKDRWTVRKLHLCWRCTRKAIQWVVEGGH